MHLQVARTLHNNSYQLNLIDLGVIYFLNLNFVLLQGGQNKKRLTMKLNEDDPNSTGLQGSLAEPLLGKKQ